MAEVAIGTAPPQVRVSLRRLLDERQAATLLIALLALVLVVIIALPLWTLLSKSFQDANGGFVGLRNFAIYFSTPTLFASLLNSVAVAALSTAIVVPLAFIYAYGLTRSCMPAKGLFYAAALLPIFAPSLLSALSLLYIFGNQGFLRQLLMGASIYGPIGIVIAEVLYCFPARALDPRDRAGARRRAPLRGGGGARHDAGPRLPDHHPAGRALRHHQRLLRGLHPRRHRFRHPEGDRRPVQRARDRRLQAGRRPAELPDGRGRRDDPSRPGGARLRGRSPRAAKAGGAVVVARRALCAEARPRARPRPSDLRRGRRAASSSRPTAWRCGRRSSPIGPTISR